MESAQVSAGDSTGDSFGPLDLIEDRILQQS